MDIVVFGAGSIGSLIGGLLADEHAVTLVGRQDHVAAIEREGLAITGRLERVVSPTARTDVPAEAELAIVTVKSFDTPEAAAALRSCSLETVLSLQNGMGNEAILEREVDATVLAGTTTYGAHSTAPGSVEYTGAGEVVLGPVEGGSSPRADEVGSAFESAGLETVVASDMPRRLWRKLAVNAGINAPTALARVPNGAVLEGSLASTASAATAETARVAQEAGVDLAVPAAVDRMESVAEATAENTSSMHQDVLAGKRTEIDAINGYVVDAASGEVPVNETLTALIRGWERSRDLR